VSVTVRGNLQLLDRSPVREPAPVFVDTSGRRRSRVEFALAAAAITCGGYVAAIGVGYAGGHVGVGGLRPWAGTATRAPAQLRSADRPPARPGQGPGATGPAGDASAPGTAGPGTAGPGTAGPGTAGPGTAGPGTAGPGTAEPDVALAGGAGLAETGALAPAAGVAPGQESTSGRRGSQPAERANAEGAARKGIKAAKKAAKKAVKTGTKAAKKAATKVTEAAPAAPVPVRPRTT
jgi:hypothetical protein